MLSIQFKYKTGGNSKLKLLIQIRAIIYLRKIYLIFET